MSKTLLLETTMHKRRDLLRLRVQGKQVARTLGFAPLNQIEIACAVFRLAAEGLRRKRKTIRFELDGDVLTVTACSPAGRGDPFVRKLTGPMEFAPEDCAWMAVQLNMLVEIDVGQAIAEQNEDTAKLIEALRQCQSELDRLRPSGSAPSAA